MKKKLFALLLAVMFFGQVVARDNGPDFNFPKDVTAQAQTDLKQALAKGDGALVVDALVRSSLAKSSISIEKMSEIIEDIDQIARKESRPDIRALLHHLEARTYSGIDSQGKLDTYGYACTEQVFTTQDNIFLDLPKETPSTTEIIGMLKADMPGTDDFLRITAKTCSDTQIPVMVASSDDTWLICNTQIVGEVVMPETFLGDMASVRIRIILDIGIGEILPGMMVLCLMLIRECRIKASLIQGSDTQVQVIDIAAVLGMDTLKRKQTGC